MLNIFLPKKENPVINHKDIIVEPLGLTPIITKSNSDNKLVRAAFTKAAPIPPTSIQSVINISDENIIDFNPLKISDGESNKNANIIKNKYKIDRIIYGG